MQLTVLKSDGSEEVYRHTKVLGTVARALSESGQYHPGVAEDLAEAVTLYLRREYGNGRVVFDEIAAMLEAALTETGYDAAALCLHDHRVNRRIKRTRTEVMRHPPLERDHVPTEPWRVVPQTAECTQAWDKSVIVRDLMRKRGVPRDLARSAAGAVEEIVLRMQCRTLSVGVIRELVRQVVDALCQAENILDEMQPPIPEPQAVLAETA